jgi:hypothetical protein
MNRQAGSTCAVPDRFVAALARYVEALDRRYPDGPAQLKAELDCRANVSVMPTVSDRKPAA